jgi:hypothetical protein
LVRAPDPVYVPFRRREVRVRHDDPRLKPYTPMAAVLRSATSIASDVEGLRLVLASTVGELYLIEVPDDGSEVRLRRRGWDEGTRTGGRGPTLARVYCGGTPGQSLESTNSTLMITAGGLSEHCSIASFAPPRSSRSWDWAGVKRGRVSPPAS